MSTAHLSPKQKKSTYLSAIVHENIAASIFVRYANEFGLSPADTMIVDLGSGSGAFAASVRPYGFNKVIGVDGYEKADVVLDINTAHIPIADKSIDAVTAWEVFEHLENPHHLAREIFRILRPDGLLIVSMPNLFHVESKLRFLLTDQFTRWTEENDHRYVHTPALIVKLFPGFSAVHRFFCLACRCSKMEESFLDS